MKTTNVILVLAIAFLFSASYVAEANSVAKENKVDAVSEDSTLMNHNRGDSKMSDSTVMVPGDMMAMMNQCKSMMQKMLKDMKSENCCSVKEQNTNKNDNPFIDPGIKEGSYNYFQSRRIKSKKTD